jgi:spermidine synthase
MRLVALMLCVGVSGASVMVYEFIAVRILQRYFGGTLDVWASEISVCLAGLAIGYVLGGMLADRLKHPGLPLGIGLIVAGALGVFMEPLIVSAYETLPEPDFSNASGALMKWWEPLFVASVSSFVPFIGLGFVMPTATRLHVRDIEHVGTSVGWIAAMSTIGSIAGALLTANYLIPAVGVRESLYLTSGVLVVMGVLIVIAALAWKPRAAAAFLVFVAAPSSAQEVIFEDYSAYHHILVQDEGNARVLYFDDDAQSTMDLRNEWTGGFEYTDFFHLPILLDPSIRNVLCVGLGGGTGPKSFLDTYAKVNVQVVEIDPKVVEVARKYFALPQDRRLKIAVADGRTFMQRGRGKYGAIIMDAYASGPNGAYLPYHLATKEFFEIAYEKLNDGGSLLYNVIGQYGDVNDEIIRGIHATLNATFEAVYVFEANSTMNTIFVAHKVPEGVERKPWPEGPIVEYPLNAAGWASLVTVFRQQAIPLPTFLERRITQFSKANGAQVSGQVFTDNKAPVD